MTMDGDIVGEWDLTDYGYGFIEHPRAQRALIEDMIRKIKHAKALQSVRALERTQKGQATK